MTAQPLREILLRDYDRSLDLDGFSGGRLAERLSAISQIGLTPGGGSQRFGYSREEAAAKELASEWMRAAGLTVRTDAAGNRFGRLEGKDNSLPLVLCGSHLDTVPNGGHFDGVLGVLLALEAVEMWKANGFAPERPYEIATFSEEEGSRFNVGLVGSSAVTGALPEDGFRSLTDHDGRSFASAVAEAGLDLERFGEAKRDLSEIAAFVEVHIEQGPILETNRVSVGIVTGICGLVSLEITVKGQAGHAGATPMSNRHDALLAASRMVVAIGELPRRFSETAVATVGQLNVFPNGSNVIPSEVRLSVDIRDVDGASLKELAEAIVETADRVAQEGKVELVCKKTLDLAPAPSDPGLRAKQAAAMRAINLPAFELPSGAGHDAMVLGAHVPMAMFFVRSKDGVSHNPREFSSLGDCALAAQALSRFLMKLLSETSRF
jgi:allantoate deiminase